MDRPVIEKGAKVFWQRRENEVVELIFNGWAKDCPALKESRIIGSIQTVDGPAMTSPYDPDGAVGTFRLTRELPKPPAPEELEVEEPVIEPVPEADAKLEKLEEILPEPKKRDKRKK